MTCGAEWLFANADETALRHITSMFAGIVDELTSIESRLKTRSSGLGVRRSWVRIPPSPQYSNDLRPRAILAVVAYAQGYAHLACAS